MYVSSYLSLTWTITNNAIIQITFDIIDNYQLGEAGMNGTIIRNILNQEGDDIYGN